MKRRWKGEGGGASRPLLLPHDEADRIAAGRKTELRRTAHTDKETGVLKPSALKHGLTYEIKASMDEDVRARITIISVTEQPLVAITPDQARAEGHHDKFDRGKASDGVRAQALFADDWMRRHDRTWPLFEEQPCPQCEGHAYRDGERCDAGCDDVGIIMVEATLRPDEILDVFKRRHGHRTVWVITFELAQHLYLHRKTDGGYTADPREALLDAGTVLDPPSPDWARNAEVHRREALRSEDGARVAGLDQLHAAYQAELLRLSLEEGTDISSDLFVIGQRHEKAKQRLSREPGDDAQAA